jgi:putative transposase
MNQKRFAVKKIVAVLKEAEAGIPVVELIQRIGTSEQTL